MFTVTWAAPVLDRLADLYVAADPADRRRMADGVEALNRRLALRPWDEGESRDGLYRLTFPPLLAVRFHVDRMADTVQVVGVARWGR
ncbi:MAG: hypothetical protein U0871_17675 [Gemmataceae bacterium]